MYGYLRCAIRESDENGTGVFTTRPLTEKCFQVLIEDWSANPHRWLEPNDLQMKPDHFVGWCYSKGNLIGEEDPDSQAQMQAMLLAWEEGNIKVRVLWSKMNAWFYQGFSQTMRNYNFIGASDSDDFFDKVWYESEHYKSGKDIIIQNIGNGVIVEESDGHVEAKLESKGLPNIVLLRKDKTSLYITQDIELLRKRLKDDGYNQVIYVVDYRQTLQFKQLFEIAKSLNLPGSENCKHLAYGEVRTPEGAMSSRKGNIISADYLLEETARRAREQISEKSELTNEEKKSISQQVALSAIKYGLLKFSIGTNIVFDISQNIKFEGETGPYLQYTYTRANSIYKQDKLTEEQICTSIAKNYQNIDTQKLAQEILILRYLEKWPGIISAASDQYSPNLICEYLYKLAQAYNVFYATHRIIDESELLTKTFRLLINLRVRQTLQKGLYLLGISTLEKM
jgi:arginyl-tRNA synthetase